MKEIHHEHTPSADLVKRYEDLLDFYLSAHNATVSIILYKDPINIHCTYSDGSHTSEWTERHWIEDVVLNTPEAMNLSVTLFSDGIVDDEQLQARAWGDAHHIQDILYKELKRLPSSPPKDDDPYWELWKKHPTHPS